MISRIRSLSNQRVMVKERSTYSYERWEKIFYRKSVSIPSKRPQQQWAGARMHNLGPDTKSLSAPIISRSRLHACRCPIHQAFAFLWGRSALNPGQTFAGPTRRQESWRPNLSLICLSSGPRFVQWQSRWQSWSAKDSGFENKRNNSLQSASPSWVLRPEDSEQYQPITMTRIRPFPWPQRKSFYTRNSVYFLLLPRARQQKDILVQSRANFIAHSAAPRRRELSELAVSAAGPSKFLPAQL